MDCIFGSAVVTLAVISAFIFILRKVITSYLEKWVDKKFSSDLEKLKSDLRNYEALRKNDIQQKSQELNSIRDWVFSIRASNKNALVEKRIKASEELWAATIKLSSGQFMAEMASRLKWDEIEKIISKSGVKEPDLTQTLKEISESENSIRLSPQVGSARLFVSPLTWALYEAYSSIIWLSHMQIELTKRGVSSSILKKEKIKEVIKAVLPHQLPLIEQHGTDIAPILLEEIKEALVKQLKHDLHNDSSDEEHIAQASRIIKAVNGIRSFEHDKSKK